MICEKLYECCENSRFACENKKNCIVYRDFRKEAVCGEKKKRYNLINDGGNLITLFHMDGGIIRDDTDVQRCDFVYAIDDQNCPTAIFVELKGKDINHAVRQLKSSIDMYGTKLKRRICARIICSSVPRMFNDPAVKGLKKELGKCYQGTLAICEKNQNERYSQI